MKQANSKLPKSEEEPRPIEFLLPILAETPLDSLRAYTKAPNPHWLKNAGRAIQAQKMEGDTPLSPLSCTNDLPNLDWSHSESIDFTKEKRKATNLANISRLNSPDFICSSKSKSISRMTSDREFLMKINTSSPDASKTNGLDGFSLLFPQDLTISRKNDQGGTNSFINSMDCILIPKPPKNQKMSGHTAQRDKSNKKRSSSCPVSIEKARIPFDEVLMKNKLKEKSEKKILKVSFNSKNLPVISSFEAKLAKL